MLPITESLVLGVGRFQAADIVIARVRPTGQRRDGNKRWKKDRMSEGVRKTTEEGSAIHQAALPLLCSAFTGLETVFNSRAVALNWLFISQCFENLMETTDLHQPAPYRATHHFLKPCSWIAGNGMADLGV